MLLGHAEVRQTYKVSGVGTVAGCYVQDGKLQRKDCQVRLVRDGIVIHEGVLASLQRFKDSVKEVQAGYECGLSIEKFNDIKEGDIVEAFTMEPDRGITNSRWVGERPPIFFLKGGTVYGRKPHRAHQ